MTQAFNLSQFANKLNTSGQIDPSSAFSSALPISQGGTNNGSLAVTAGGVLYTDGSKVVNVGAGTSGQVLKSNGSGAPSWQNESTGGYRMSIFTSSGSFNVPNVTQAKVTVIGGGGGGVDFNNPLGYSGIGGGALAWITGFTVPVTVTVGTGGLGSNNTNGAPGNTSSFGSFISATGGTGGPRTGGTAANGTGTISNVGPTGFGLKVGTTPLVDLFGGSTARSPAGGATGNIVWSQSTGLSPGARGGPGTLNTTNDASGGVDGVVLVEY